MYLVTIKAEGSLKKLHIICESTIGFLIAALLMLYCHVFSWIVFLYPWIMISICLMLIFVLQKGTKFVGYINLALMLVFFLMYLSRV